MKIDDIMILEEYEASVKSPHKTEKLKIYSVYKNPTPNELGDLKNKWKNDDMGMNAHVSFISHITKDSNNKPKHDLYVVDRRILHDKLIPKLGLPITQTEKMDKAFMGIARITDSNKLKFVDSNQNGPDSGIENIIKHHEPVLRRYFQE